MLFFFKISTIQLFFLKFQQNGLGGRENSAALCVGDVTGVEHRRAEKGGADLVALDVSQWVSVLHGED